MTVSLRKSRQWFGDLKHNGIKLRKYYLWYQRVFFLMLILAAASAAWGCHREWQAYQEDTQLLAKHVDLKLIKGVRAQTFLGWLWSVGLNRRGTWHTVSASFAGVAILMVIGKFVYPPKLMCPHCDENIKYTATWTCAYCHRRHETGGGPDSWFMVPTFLSRCRNLHCRERPVSIDCTYCGKPVPLTAQPKNIPEHRRPARSATLALARANHPDPYAAYNLPASQNGEQKSVVPAGRIRVRSLDGIHEGTIDASDFDPTIMEKI